MARGQKLKKRKPAQLSQDKLKICPGGNASCALCKVGTPDDLQYLNYLRFEKKFTYKQIREYLKATFKISPNETTISRHYLQHVSCELQVQKLSCKKGHQRNKKTAVSKAIDNLPREKRIISNQDMETAYHSLTQLANRFTKKVEQIYGMLNLDEKKLKKKLKDVDPLKGMETVAKLSKEARELLSDLSKLRSPKIVVAHFLEQAIDQVILETGFVLSDAVKNIQEDLLEAIRTKKTINTEVFGKIFHQTGEEYRRKMLDLRRDQLAKATATLADLEKLI